MKREFTLAVLHALRQPRLRERLPLPGAIAKRPEDGIVVVDKSKCIGCHYCFMACPFGVPQYTDEGMDKCDCCIGNGVTPGDTPHCVLACPTQALQFGELGDLSQIASEQNAAAILACLWLPPTQLLPR